MQAHDYEDFRRLLTGVNDFYGKELSEFALSVWWEALKPFDVSVVSQAFSRHVTNPDSGQFPPKPADIVRMIGGRSEDKAMRAWAKVDKALRQVGTYASVVFDDPGIHRVLHDMGGWVGLGQKTEDEWPFVAREFENRYRGFAMRGEAPEYPRVLVGLCEAHNAVHGRRIEPPMLIGDTARAQAVMNGGADKPLLQVTPLGGAALRLVGDRAALATTRKPGHGSSRNAMMPAKSSR